MIFYIIVTILFFIAVFMAVQTGIEILLDIIFINNTNAKEQKNGGDKT